MIDQKKIHGYAYLDQLSTEQLEELLRSDSKTMENGNDDSIFYILEMIEKREKEHPTGRLPDVDKAWEDFQKYYNTPEGEGRSLYPSEGKNDSEMAMGEADHCKASAKRHLHRRLRRILVSAAAMVCLVIFMMPPALGYENIFEMIAHWTAEQFSFSNNSENPVSDHRISSDPKNKGEYGSLQEALEQYGINDAVVPQSIPDGFQPEEIWVQEYPVSGNIEFVASYANGDDYIVITIVQHSGQSNKIYEKNDQAVERYLSGDVEHYIFHNNKNITAAWHVDSLECSISTTLSVTELEKIIDSIYEE